MTRWTMLIDIEPQTDPGSATLRTKPAVYPPIKGVAYDSTIEALGGTPPYTFTASVVLPTGLLIDAATGVISGTPSGSVGHVESEIRVTDSLGATFYNIVGFDVIDALTLTGIFPEGEETAAYDAGLTLIGATGAVTWGVVGTVAGLSFNTGTGVFSGTPTAAGSYPVTITATDSLGLTTSAARTITIAPVLDLLPFAVYNRLPAGMIGAVYDYRPTIAGGVAPITYEITTGAAAVANAGLLFDPSTGRIYGTPTAKTTTAAVPVTIRGTDFVNVQSSLSSFLGVSLVSRNPAAHYSTTFTGDGVSTSFTPFIDTDMFIASIEIYEIIGGLDYKVSVNYYIDQTVSPPSLYIGDFKVAPSFGQTFRVVALGGVRS